jgi:hypothetical protein
MNECLGWTGLGHCGGGDIGCGTMGIFCLVVNAEKATLCIIEELRQHGLLAEAKVILSPDPETDEERRRCSLSRA